MASGAGLGMFQWSIQRPLFCHVLCTEVIQNMLDFQGLDPLAHIANNDEEPDEEENEEEVFEDERQELHPNFFPLYFSISPLDYLSFAKNIFVLMKLS